MSKAILFVDDNEVLCRLTCDILAMEGYRAVPAFNGEQALAVFDADSFDVVVTDFRMEGMNGLELARALRGRSPNTPILMVTAFDPIEGDEIVECLQKERMFPLLLEKIRELVESE